MRSLRCYPQELVLAGQVYEFVRILKDDMFSINVLYLNHQGDGQVLKLSDFRVPFGRMLRPIAALLARHEYRMYQMMDNIPGVPRLGSKHGWRGFLHQYVEGKTLFELPRNYVLPAEFFPKLRMIVDEMHRRRILHLDLQKRGNIILAHDGLPYLIDYQLSLRIRTGNGWVGRCLGRVLDRMKREDLYHIYKHMKRYQASRMTPDELALAQRSRLNNAFYRYVGEPYRRIKRLIYPKGSNEIIWYKWKRTKDRTERIP